MKKLLATLIFMVIFITVFGQNLIETELEKYSKFFTDECIKNTNGVVDSVNFDFSSNQYTVFTKIPGYLQLNTVKMAIKLMEYNKDVILYEDWIEGEFGFMSKYLININSNDYYLLGIVGYVKGPAVIDSITKDSFKILLYNFSKIKKTK